MKVLLVDDSTLVRERLKALLGELAEVEILDEARDGVEAIESTRKLNPDVVILDTRLSNGNGIQTLQKIKEAKSSPTVIMLTNYPYPQYRKRCTDLGADFFFDKSSEFEKIPGVLKQLTRDFSKQLTPKETNG